MLTYLIVRLICAFLLILYCVTHFLAVRDGLMLYFDIGTIFAVLVAFLIGYIPLIGWVIAYYGAVEAWGMEWYWAALMLFWFVPVAAAALLPAVIAMFRDAFRR